jgi:negative regulator of flagellin synthesis FlgM
MEIDKIGAINNIQKTEQVKKGKKIKSAQDNMDSVNLSNQAKLLAERSKYIDVVRETPDVRKARIAELKEKINSEAYLSEVIGDKLADKIAKSLGINI